MNRERFDAARYGFCDWLREREYMSPTMNHSVCELPEVPPMRDVRVVEETYNQIQNDIKMLRSFAAVVLDCDVKEVTPRRLFDYCSSRADFAHKEIARLMNDKTELQDKVFTLLDEISHLQDEHGASCNCDEEEVEP